jgi:hypothetical protein
LQFDNRQKQMGKPSSDELKKAEMIAKFQKEHPEMDFSNVRGLEPRLFATCNRS